MRVFYTKYSWQKSFVEFWDLPEDQIKIEGAECRVYPSYASDGGLILQPGFWFLDQATAFLNASSQNPAKIRLKNRT